MDAKPKILREIGLSDAEIGCFIALSTHGALTVRDLTRLTNIKRPTAYYALRQLCERGIVSRTGSPGTERFQAEAPVKLKTILTRERRKIDALEKELDTFIPTLAEMQSPYGGLPAISFFEGAAAMKQVIMDTLYCRSRHIDSLAPSDNFFWQVGQEFSARYRKERVQRGITTRNLWEASLKPEIMAQSYKHISQVRILPDIMHGKFRTTIFLFDDQVMYISSKTSGYVLLVRSEEHYQTMKALYDGLWEMSQQIDNGK